jgi:hypothetical protein
MTEMAGRWIVIDRLTGHVRLVFFCRGSRDDLRPLRSESWKRNSQGTGTNTQFSGLGNTPTGELGFL